VNVAAPRKPAPANVLDRQTAREETVQPSEVVATPVKLRMGRGSERTRRARCVMRSGARRDGLNRGGKVFHIGARDTTGTADTLATLRG